MAYIRFTKKGILIKNVTDRESISQNVHFNIEIAPVVFHVEAKFVLLSCAILAATNVMFADRSCSKSILERWKQFILSMNSLVLWIMAKKAQENNGDGD
jgi:hypothetical protein